MLKNRFQNGIWREGWPKTVSKRVFGWSKTVSNKVFEGRSGQNTFPRGILAGGAVKHCSRIFV